MRGNLYRQYYLGTYDRLILPECAYLESPPVECVLGEHPPALPHGLLDQRTAEAVLGFDVPGLADLKLVQIMIL